MSSKTESYKTVELATKACLKIKNKVLLKRSHIFTRCVCVICRCVGGDSIKMLHSVCCLCYVEKFSITSKTDQFLNSLINNNREEHRLRVFENRVLRRIFGPKRTG